MGPNEPPELRRSAMTRLVTVNHEKYEMLKETYHDHLQHLELRSGGRKTCLLCDAKIETYGMFHQLELELHKVLQFEHLFQSVERQKDHVDDDTSLELHG